MKYWLEVSPDEQTRRLESRIDDPRKIWKLSDLDLLSYTKWDEYGRARDEMFAATDTAWAPWFVAHSDDKKRARLNVITHLLGQVPYEPVEGEDGQAPEAQGPRRASTGGASRCDTSRRRSEPSQEARTHGSDGSGRGDHRPTRTSGGTPSSADDVAARLGVDPATGIDAPTARGRLATDGPNALPAEEGVPGWRRFLQQYAAYMQIILLIAAVVSFAIGEWSTGLLLLVLTVVNAVVGLRQEGKAESAMNALKSLTKQSARVRRGGVESSIPVEEVVARRRGADHRGRQRGRRRTDHRGELARHRRVRAHG